MRLFALTMVGLLMLALAGLEMVMSALPEEPTAPFQVREELNGSALPADAARPPALLCSGQAPLEPVTIDDAAGF